MCNSIFFIYSFDTNAFTDAQLMHNACASVHQSPENLCISGPFCASVKPFLCISRPPDKDLI